MFFPFLDNKNKFKETGIRKEKAKTNSSFLILSGLFNILSILGINITGKNNIKIIK